MRLIDADELIEAVWRERLDTRERIADLVARQPTVKGVTADVQPVKQGKWVERKTIRMKWIPNDDDNVNPDDVEPERMTEQKCSYCNRWTIKFTDHIEINYCPLCGAKMDGDSE